MGYGRNLPSSSCLEGRKLSGMDRHRRFARAEDKVARLSKQGLDMVAFWRASSPVLADAVPQAVAPCSCTPPPMLGPRPAAFASAFCATTT
jgi:hypothetical protein